MEYHVPVLLKESVEGLNIRAGGVYVDLTFGGGGHSREIYSRLSAGKLIAFDQDPDSEENTREFDSDESRSFLFVLSNFKYLKKYLKLHGISKVDGILADLGISSHQIDVGERGFSTRYDGPLDMRMNQVGQKSAFQVVNNYSEKDLIHLLSLYGEIKNARTLTKKIIQDRLSHPIETTNQLRQTVLPVAPKGKVEKYMAQIFQAIRIEVNDEVEILKDVLKQCSECMIEGGRLAVISYHSLEDRLVKNFLNTGNFQGKPQKDFYGNLIRPFRPVIRKPIIPTSLEIEKNTRARSAKLRIGEKEDGS